MDPEAAFPAGEAFRTGGANMRFVVKPQAEEPESWEFITMCALCSEDPRFCNYF